MPLPDADVDRIRKWVAAENGRIGEHIKEMRIEMDVHRNLVTIVECRPPWEASGGSEWTRQEVARLRFERSIGWTLYWPDRNSEFHLYGALAPTSKVQRLLDEINDDPTCIFWG